MMVILLPLFCLLDSVLRIGSLLTEIFAQSVSVPTTESWSTSILQFSIDYNLQSDALLGLDWIGMCQAVMSNGIVSFLPSSPETVQPLSPRNASSLLVSNNPVFSSTPNIKVSCCLCFYCASIKAGALSTHKTLQVHYSEN